MAADPAEHWKQGVTGSAFILRVYRHMTGIHLVYWMEGCHGLPGWYLQTEVYRRRPFIQADFLPVPFKAANEIIASLAASRL